MLSKAVSSEISRYAKAGLLERLASDYSGDLLFADYKHGHWLDYFIRLDVPFHLDTNGSFLSGDRISKLTKSRVESVNVSVDAATPETFKRIRVGPVGLEQILENTRKFVRQLKADNRHDVTVSLGFTLMRSNIHELVDLVKIASELGIKRIHGRHLEAYESRLYDESLINHQSLYNLWRARALEIGSNYGVNVGLPEPFSNQVGSGKGHHHCDEPWRSAVILGNSDVMACCVPGTKMGNLSEQSLEEIWNGPAYQKLRRTVNSTRPPNICNSCPIFRFPHNRSSYELADSDSDRRQTDRGGEWVFRSQRRLIPTVSFVSETPAETLGV